MIHKELTEKIIKASMTVHNALGFGFMEKVYENALMVELGRLGMHAEQQIPLHVYYREHLVGDYIADIVVDNTVVLELKSVEKIGRIHEVQLVNYLKATGKDVGILLNFGNAKLEFKRKVLHLPDERIASFPDRIVAY